MAAAVARSPAAAVREEGDEHAGQRDRRQRHQAGRRGGSMAGDLPVADELRQRADKNGDHHGLRTVPGYYPSQGLAAQV
jgi:hypothetical protein